MPPDALRRYADARGLTLGGLLGEGKDGAVYRTTRPSAAKLHVNGEVYRRERDAYFRLGDVEMDEVAGLNIPKLIDQDNDLFVLEMTVVSPPFLLDFASAYLDDPPDWPEDVMEDWHGQLRDRFDDRYDDVLAVLAELEGAAGVHLFDVHADNLKFAPAKGA